LAALKRLLLPGALLLAAYWAVFGGEYSVFEVRRAREARQDEAAELVRLQVEVDSLRAWADALENDPDALERLARERFGMIREGELLYRFTEPMDSAARPEGSASR